MRSTELAADLARKCGGAVTLRFSERSLTDCRPLSLLGNASVRALGSELGMTLDRRRFRANLYADWRADQPHRENDLAGRTLAIGERVRIAILQRDPRCQMIAIDPWAVSSTLPRATSRTRRRSMTTSGRQPSLGLKMIGAPKGAPMRISRCWLSLR